MIKKIFRMLSAIIFDKKKKKKIIFRMLSAIILVSTLRDSIRLPFQGVQSSVAYDILISYVP